MSSIRPQRAIGATRALGLFESLAESAWHWLGHARSLRLGFSEDTISDLTALEIARLVPDEVGIGRVSKYKERFVGFDWMWIISRPRGHHAIYVVQAKKMRIDRLNGYSYGRVKYPSSPPYQIDVLQDFARHIGAVPLYCFYNNVDGITVDPFWQCLRKSPSAPQMGCTLVPVQLARLVQDGQISNNFQSIHQMQGAIPWRCLFHAECTSFNLHSVSEGRMEIDVLDDKARNRGGGIAEFLTESVSEGGNLLDFDDFVRRFELEEIVERSTVGARRAMMERTLSIRLEE